jgi:hypothetical protein
MQHWQPDYQRRIVSAVAPTLAWRTGSSAGTEHVLVQHQHFQIGFKR